MLKPVSSWAPSDAGSQLSALLSLLGQARGGYNISVPELWRFFGIITRMYFEAMEPHHTPHFHAYYHEEVAVYQIDPVELLAGSLPKRQQRLVEAWAELHQQRNFSVIGSGARREIPLYPLPH